MREFLWLEKWKILIRDGGKICTWKTHARIRTIRMHNRGYSYSSLLGFQWLVTLQKVGVYYAYEIGES